MGMAKHPPPKSGRCKPHDEGRTSTKAHTKRQSAPADQHTQGRQTIDAVEIVYDKAAVPGLAPSTGAIEMGIGGVGGRGC
jgi:hypothetical protein